jgi:hypothetical protein
MTTLMRSRYRRAVLLAALAAVGGAGCGADAAKSGAASGAVASGSAAEAAPASAAPVAPMPTFDARWERAKASGDPADLDDVAEQGGALGLVAALDDAKFGAVARAALPRARDRELAVAPLARRAKAAGATDEVELRTLLDVAGVPFPIDERLDPEGLREAFAILRQLAADSARSAAARALAVSSLRRLVALGVGSAADVPGTLD